MDITNFTNQLHKRISNSTDLNEILIISKALEKLNIVQVKIVTTFSDISSLNLIDGDLIFVDDEDKLYFNSFLNDKNFILSIFEAISIELYGFGSNGNGRLGDNTITSRLSPVSVVGGFIDWISASAGNSHSLGLRANGTLWAWGNNLNGRLGDNTITSSRSPVSVVGGFTDWVQASAGNSHSLGVRANGTVWAWGLNTNGRLGDNSTTDRSSPVSVVGGFTDWIEASAGGDHSLGVRANGTLWAWGENVDGQLGDNTLTSRLSPVSVVGGFVDWASASAGTSHSLGVRANGTLWAWGLNSFGRLGDDSTATRSSPVSVVGGFTDWISASAGMSHSLGVRTNGTVWAWGLNTDGRLGNNLITSRNSPVSVVGGFTDWVQASAGDYHSLGVRANGTLWAWGNNGNGRLGDNTITSRLSPVSVVGGFTDWVSASAGGAHSLGVTIVKRSV
jgi:alpha-tubulin suppressor-like RCC1 family protein